MAARRSNAATLIVSIVMACGLWAYVTLTRTYEDDIDVPITVVPPAGQTIISNVPMSVSTRVRTSGLQIANLLLYNHPKTCTLALAEQAQDEPNAFRISNATLVSQLAASLGVRVLSVSPVDITLRTGTPELKSVPLVVSHGIMCRPGFIMPSEPRADRASVTLRGIKEVLEPLTQWSTKKIILDDVHESLTIDVPLSDSLRSMVDVMPKTVRVHFPVQQVADVTIEDVEITLAKGLADMGYVIRPGRLRVTLRGGVQDLSELTRLDLRCQISAVPTNGVVVPVVTCPRGMRVISTFPRTVLLVRRQVASLRNSSDESP
ncbi:MAG: hypothetical protein FGM33_05895 [Candidatus Kapabacteria bacterium]|nr:hypothetical protein [Candidatus Kapabacteria bacterium]